MLLLQLSTLLAIISNTIGEQKSFLDTITSGGKSLLMATCEADYALQRFWEKHKHLKKAYDAIQLLEKPTTQEAIKKGYGKIIELFPKEKHHCNPGEQTIQLSTNSRDKFYDVEIMLRVGANCELKAIVQVYGELASFAPTINANGDNFDFEQCDGGQEDIILYDVNAEDPKMCLQACLLEPRCSHVHWRGSFSSRDANCNLLHRGKVDIGGQQFTFDYSRYENPICGYINNRMPK